MSSSRFVHLDVAEITAETEKAFQVRLEDGSTHWLPRSVVADADDYNVGDCDLTLSVQAWFCEKEGLG
jgi:hypothetical protein